MPIVNEILKDRPQNCYLFRFIADSPTVTMQRLKGLTTGTLPTFIDVGSNFGAPAIVEDNIIHQLANHTTPDRRSSGFSKNIIFMGDDTWESLFPDHFQEKHPYPSLNIKDLHTVDNGVIHHLLPILAHEKSDDWDILIGHLLGVDHVGHRHGPSHPAMGAKLAQVDELIKKVVDMLDNDTILFVMGDHGMTFDGDHGGSSLDELYAALFVYSPRGINSSPVTGMISGN
jgi:phosphatidylinositol glycan class O